MPEVRPSQELVAAFVGAAHGHLPTVQKLLEEHPELLNAEWTRNDNETAIQAASQVGNVPIAEYLLSKGAPMAICTAAMLGRKHDVERMLKENPKNIDTSGAHGIPLLPHAALSGNLDLVQFLYTRGAKKGVSEAFHNSVRRNFQDTAEWLLENGKPDLAWKDYQGKTALAVAKEKGYAKIAQLLQQHGAPA